MATITLTLPTYLSYLFYRASTGCDWKGCFKINKISRFFSWTSSSNLKKFKRCLAVVQILYTHTYTRISHSTVSYKKKKLKIRLPTTSTNFSNKLWQAEQNRNSATTATLSYIIGPGHLFFNARETKP